MTQAEYADMVDVMQFSRGVCEMLYTSLKNRGLIEKGFRLNLYIGDFKHDDVVTETSRIELETDILEDDELWNRTRMYQSNITGLREDSWSGIVGKPVKGWVVDHDPMAETGTVPPVVKRRKASQDVRKGAGKDPGKHDPLDGMWLSVHDDPADVAGGE